LSLPSYTARPSAHENKKKERYGSESIGSVQNKVKQKMAHYIGIDVGTGSARACLIDESGEMLALATRQIRTWNEKADYYVGALFPLLPTWSMHVCVCADVFWCRNNRRRIFGLLLATARGECWRRVGLRRRV